MTETPAQRFKRLCADEDYAHEIVNLQPTRVFTSRAEAISVLKPLLDFDEIPDSDSALLYLMNGGRNRDTEPYTRTLPEVRPYLWYRWFIKYAGIPENEQHDTAARWVDAMEQLPEIEYDDSVKTDEGFMKSFSIWIEFKASTTETKRPKNVFFEYTRMIIEHASPDVKLQYDGVDVDEYTALKEVTDWARIVDTIKDHLLYEGDSSIVDDMQFVSDEDILAFLERGTYA